MLKTPKSLRLHLGLFGRTNVGKSSFLNMVAGQDVSITSPMPGTTTDVVEKPMELLPIGPVVFLDTGGIDDTSVLARRRIDRTQKVFDRSDIIILITEPERWSDFEERIVHEAAQRKIPFLVAVNKTDIREPSEGFIQKIKAKTKYLVFCSSLNIGKRDDYVNTLKSHLLEICPDDFIKPPPLIGDLLPPKSLVILIVPIDLEAPKGRLILPQVQTIRDILDHHGGSLTVKESEYAQMLTRLKTPPDLVVCDSQVVDRMVRETPEGICCTTFSILFSRLKGDLDQMLKGVRAVGKLKPKDKVLIAEACSHHPLEDDIGRIKIPKWLTSYVGGDIQFDVCSGRDFPGNLKEYKLIIHCGACMFTRREMLSRIQKAQEAGVPITNYGICISYLQGVLERVLIPFPGALETFQQGKTDRLARNVLC
ncbi:MAG: [FeFe] hydrogenase H-cluster maturation GTPase HydF [Candidatus Omnitrophica bacterium]|nr:[FeFe] hydrogenase H-cluster maturation GTPase HydF [Candidatus Omnitrophota bacterium]